MKHQYWFFILIIFSTQTLFANTTVQRFALVAGANFGGSEREPLRYAVSDAERFIRILEEMGGINKDDYTLLREPNIKDFQNALAHLQTQITTKKSPESRVEVILYYSGHADEEGLLLGEDRLPYRSLRNTLDNITADIHITVLDACASGAITRLKGGQRQKAFMVDESSNMRGYAFLTSSSENEAAQESDRIRGSFFTHYLISGLRGAADISGDGKVTLHEAYHFAHDGTFKRTIKTQGGVQHPAYDIKMTGTGDVVLTDVRQTSASLLLAESLNGRLFVHNANEHLVAELNKIAGRTIELGLEPGIYDIHFEQKTKLKHAAIALEKGQRFLLETHHFKSEKRETTTSRGTQKPPSKKTESRNYPHKLAGKFRAEYSLGTWNPGDDSKAWIFGVFPTEHIAVNYIRSGFSVAGNTDTLKTGISSELVTLRIYLPLQLLRSPLRPYAEGGVGRYKGEELGLEGDKVEGYYWGGGLDVPIWGGVVVGGRAGYHYIPTLSTPVNNRTDYSGLEFGVGIGLLIF